MESDVKKYWEREAHDHAATAYQYAQKPDEIRYPFFEVRRDRLFEIIDGLKPGRILDAGCGCGEILLECLQLGWDGYGCDISDNMVAYARKRLQENGHDPGRVIASSITAIPQYADSFFDAIVCPGVLEYLTEEEEARAFAEFRRTLKPAGTLIVENVNALFDLSTFNRFTVALFKEHFLPHFFKAPREVEEITAMLRGLVTFPDKPDLAGKYATTRDQVYNRTEVPLVYGKKVAGYGFKEIDQVFYRFHAVPPLLFLERPELEKVSIPLEKALCRHWIANFLATGFVSVLKIA